MFQAAMARVGAATARASGGGAGLGERKFDEKRWSDSKKELVNQFVRTDQMTDKEVPDHAARAAATAAMNRIKAAGDIDPADASVVVSGVVSRVQAAAGAAAKGDQAKYEKFLAAGVDHELGKMMRQPQDGGGAESAPKPAPQAPGKPVAKPAAKAAPPREINISTPDRNVRTGLEDKSDADLMAMRASKDPVQRMKAEQEIRRRGLSGTRAAGSANVSIEQG